MTAHVIFSARATRRHCQSTAFSLAETDRERKHTKSRDTVPGRSGQIYSKNFCKRRKVSSLGGVGGGVQGSQEGARRGQEGGRARGPPGLPGPPLRLHSGLEFS